MVTDERDTLEAKNKELETKILDIIAKVNQTETHQATTEDKMKTLMDQMEAVEKELQGTIQTLKDKKADLEARSQISQVDLQAAYDQGQDDCKISINKEVLNAFCSYFDKGWSAALDALKMEDASTLRAEENILPRRPGPQGKESRY